MSAGLGGKDMLIGFPYSRSIVDLHAYMQNRYRCQDAVSLPFKVLPVINEMGRTRLEVNVQVCDMFIIDAVWVNKLLLTRLCPGCR